MTEPVIPVHIFNAVVEETYLGTDQFGYLSYIISFKIASGIHSSYGTHDLRFYGTEIICKLLKVIGAGSWEKLVGKPIRIKKQSGCTIDIGNWLEDDWLDLKTMANKIVEASTDKMIET